MTQETDPDYEIITVRLPKEDYEILKDVLNREKAYSWLIKRLKSWWIWTLGGGILTLILLYKETIGAIISKAG